MFFFIFLRTVDDEPGSGSTTGSKQHTQRKVPHIATENGVCMSANSIINPTSIGVNTVNSAAGSGMVICYDSDSRIYFVSETILGSVKLNKAKQGLSPTMIVDRSSTSVLDLFKSTVEGVVKKPIKYYTRNQNAPTLSIFLSVKKNNEQDCFPIKIDGEEKFLPISEINKLKGAYKLIIKSGILRDSSKDYSAYVWSLNVVEMIIDTSVEVPNKTGFKFAQFITL
jgi:hypothetical protein